jgi:hypothetical protein
LGIGGPWVDTADSAKSSFSIYIGVCLSLLLLLLMLLNSFKESNLKQKNLNLLVAAGYLSILLLSLNVYLQGSRSNYIYVKTFTYFIPLIMFGIYNSYIAKDKKIIDNKLISAILCLLILANTSNYLLKINKTSAFTINSAIGIILTDSAAQKELAQYNYLTTYRPISAALGVFGDVNWIAKAPNDINLESRINREIRII